MKVGRSDGKRDNDKKELLEPEADLFRKKKQKPGVGEGSSMSREGSGEEATPPFTCFSSSKM